MHNYIYTLIIIKYKDFVLLQNRIKSPWNGMWNGIGGKKEHNESSMDCIIREVYEETTIKLDKGSIIEKGVVTWASNKDPYYSGMHLYYVELNETHIDILNTNEGIICWKNIDWAIQEDNLGVASNMKHLLEHVKDNKIKYQYHCIFKGKELIKVETSIL